MYIKTENNIITVAQKNQEDLTGYQLACETEEQIINMANGTGTTVQINGAFYNPEDNADVQAEKESQKRNQQKALLQGQIDSLEKEAGPRPFRDYMINTVKDYGAVTEAYPNGKIKDIDDMITELRNQINELG